MNTPRKVVAITGASQGIGAGLVQAFRDRGYAVVANSRSIKPSNDPDVLAIAGDVSDRDVAQRVIAQAVAKFGRIDTLVNNAGIGMWARFDEMEDVSSFDHIMRVNYMGSVYCTHFALPHLKQTRGRIVGVSSLTGKTGVPTRSGYAASKHAMAGFFDSLRIELEESGVSVTMIYPGFVATEIRERAIGPDGQPLGKGNSPVREREVMSAEECARQTLAAAAARRRELVMTWRGKIGWMLKLVAPRVVDRMAAKAIAEGK
jgi:NAD(P)-dependent dehydrogenase (short-subunit alcohol dehydrogenase family)